MMRKLAVFALGCIIFAAFVGFSYLVDKDLFIRFDFDTTVRLQSNIPTRFDSYLSILSLIGSFEVVSLFLIGILLIRRKIVEGFFVLSGFVGFHALEIYGKLFVEHLPPPEFMIRTEKLLEFPQFHVRAEYSYPSGHAGRAAFVSTFLFLIIGQSKKLSKLQKIILLAIMGIYDMGMVVSRVSLGEHWTTDVIGGVLLGASLALLTSLVYVGKRKQSKYRKQSRGLIS